MAETSEREELEDCDPVNKLITDLRDREVLLALILGAWDQAQQHQASASFYNWFAVHAAPQIRTALRMEGDRTDG